MTWPHSLVKRNRSLKFISVFWNVCCLVQTSCYPYSSHVTSTSCTYNKLQAIAYYFTQPKKPHVTKNKTYYLFKCVCKENEMYHQKVYCFNVVKHSPKLLIWETLKAIRFCFLFFSSVCVVLSPIMQLWIHSLNYICCCFCKYR